MWSCRTWLQSPSMIYIILSITIEIADQQLLLTQVRGYQYMWLLLSCYLFVCRFLAVIYRVAWYRRCSPGGNGLLVTRGVCRPLSRVARGTHWWFEIHQQVVHMWKQFSDGATRLGQLITSGIVMHMCTLAQLRTRTLLVVSLINSG
jgi:hypothetical protein